MDAIVEKFRPLEVLLVEDNAAEVRLMVEAFLEVTPTTRLHVARDGADALAFLRREERYADAPSPDLVLLDLNMPKMDGREVLARIKQDESLRRIPTVVLTTSDVEDDVSICYNLQANCYLAKPTEWDRLKDLVTCINTFWLSKARLPQQRAGDPGGPDPIEC